LLHRGKKITTTISTCTRELKWSRGKKITKEAERVITDGDWVADKGKPFTQGGTRWFAIPLITLTGHRCWVVEVPPPGYSVTTNPRLVEALRESNRIKALPLEVALEEMMAARIAADPGVVAATARLAAASAVAAEAEAASAEARTEALVAAADAAELAVDTTTAVADAAIAAARAAVAASEAASADTRVAACAAARNAMAAAITANDAHRDASNAYAAAVAALRPPPAAAAAPADDEPGDPCELIPGIDYEIEELN
jgi:hypothetical protein